MADLIVKNATLFATAETTEGTADNAESQAGDAVLCRDIAIEYGLEMGTREYQGTPGQRAPVAGAMAGAGVSLATELKGNGSTTIPEIDALIRACMGDVAAANLASTISGTSGSSTILDVADATNASVGSLAMVETATADTYEVVGLITTVDTGATPDDVTVTPGAVNGAYATNGKKVYELRTHQLKVPPTSNNSVTIDVHHNADAGASQRDRLVGCRGTFSVNSPRAGQIPSWSFNFTGWSWAQSVAATRPTPSYDTTSPKPGIASYFRVDGTATNAYDISFNLGAEVAQKMSQNATNGVYGTPTVKVVPTGSFKIHPAHTSIAEFTAWQAGTQRSLLFQVGNTLYNTWAIFIPKMVVTKVSRVDDSGVGALQIDWVGIDQNDASPTTLASGFASIYVGIG